ILLVRTRRRLAHMTAMSRDEAIAARAEIDRAHALLLSEPQVLVAWPATGEKPELLGDVSLVAGETNVLAFAQWLPPETAGELDRSLDALRARGVSFAMNLVTRTNQLIEAEGQVIGGRAILRFREVSGIKYQLAELRERHQKCIADGAALQSLIAA